MTEQPPEPKSEPKTDPKTEEASFEQATSRLGKIVDELERGDLPLERALALFEEGIHLARRAEEKINSAERRVEELLAIDPSGRPVTKPLDLGAAQEADEDDS